MLLNKEYLTKILKLCLFSCDAVLSNFLVNILVKTVCCDSWLQSSDALNFVQFFSGPHCTY